MRLRGTLGAVGLAAILTTGGCSSGWSTEDIGCAAFVDEGQMSIQSFAKVMYRCLPELPEEMIVHAELTIHIPTRDGGSVYLSVHSNAPKSAGLEAYAQNSDFVFIGITNPHSNKVDATISLDKQGEDAPSMQWESMMPGPGGQLRRQRVAVGLQRGPARVELIPEYAEDAIGDPTSPKLVACLRAAILQQVTQVAKSTNTQNDTPKLAPLPLGEDCAGI